MKISLLFSKLRLIYHTIKPLKLKQIYSFILLLLKTHLLKKIIIRKTAKAYRTNTPSKMQLVRKPYLDCEHDLLSKTLIFLNKRVQFQNQIEWNKPDLEKLWLYNLHYFDYLIKLTNQVDEENYITAKKIINEWIENNPIGYGNGWEPYPISLRVVNLIYFYYFYYQFFEEDEDFKNTFLGNLYQQCYYLTFFIEYHLLANHLFKNGKAIFIAGLVFNNLKWLKIGYRILEKELDEQILSDGGHFERSAMYHALILEDILDIINFMKGFQIDLLLVTFTELQQKAQNMLKWMQNMLHPDNEIALFGDAALNATLRYDQLSYYYRILLGKEDKEEVSDLFIPLTASGYFAFRSEEQFLVIDCGMLGPGYQPGHAHCDLLSYEYSYAGCRFIVDSGIGNYLPSQLRKKARGIYAHNTVVVNKLDQAELWQAFRMGKRIKSIDFKYDESDDEIHCVGSYNNNLTTSENYRHKRMLTFINKSFFYFEDVIEVKRIKSLESLIHIHPECVIKLDGNTVFISRDSKQIVLLYDLTSAQIEVRDWFYVPEFGKVIDTKVIVLKPNIENQVRLSYIICPLVYLEQCRGILRNAQLWGL